MQLRKVGNHKVWLSIDTVKTSGNSCHRIYELRFHKNQDWFAQMICTFKDNEIRLHWIQVTSKFQDLGYGTFLINQVLKYGKKVTACTHYGAIRFFIKHQFIPRPNKDNNTLLDLEWSPDWVKL